jgi:hypothetical protein
MSSQAVFNPNLNVVGVDPDTNQVIQIPGSEFQAPINNDTYADIVLYPDMFSSHNDGKYTLGFGLKLAVTKMGQKVQGATSFFMRPTNPHISVMSNNKDFYTMTIDRKYDKYFEWSDFIEYEQYGHSKDSYSKNQYERGWVKFNYNAMKNDNIYFPEDYSDQAQGWELQRIKLSLNFDIEIYPDAFSTNSGGHINIPYNSSEYALAIGPYNSPAVIPIRAHIQELLAAGRR